MQRVGTLQRDYDLTVSLPPALREVLLHDLDERVGDGLLVAGQTFVVRGTEHHRVLIGRQAAPTCQLSHAVLRLTAKTLRDLLRDDLAAEHACEGVTHQTFELALEALCAPHRDPSSSDTRPVASHDCCPVRSVATPAGQFRWYRSPPRGRGPPSGRPESPVLAFESDHSGRVAEWQTRTVQVRVSERMWGFNSPLAHPLRFHPACPRHARRPPACRPPRGRTTSPRGAVLCARCAGRP